MQHFGILCVKLCEQEKSYKEENERTVPEILEHS